MKKLLKVITILLSLASLPVNAQHTQIIHPIPAKSATASQNVFSAVSLNDLPYGNTISFSVPRTQNVSNFRIEAGNDSGQMQLIGLVSSIQNSTLPATYTFRLTADLLDFAYYRIVQVSMSQHWNSSPIIHNPPYIADPNLQVSVRK